MPPMPYVWPSQPPGSSMATLPHPLDARNSLSDLSREGSLPGVQGLFCVPGAASTGRSIIAVLRLPGNWFPEEVSDYRPPPVVYGPGGFR